MPGLLRHVAMDSQIHDWRITGAEVFCEMASRDCQRRQKDCLADANVLLIQTCEKKQREQALPVAIPAAFDANAVSCFLV